MLKLLQQVEQLTRGTSAAPRSLQSLASPAAVQQPADPAQPGAPASEPAPSQLPRMFSQMPSQLLALKELGDKQAEAVKQRKQAERKPLAALGSMKHRDGDPGTIGAGRVSHDDLGSGDVRMAGQKHHHLLPSSISLLSALCQHT